MEVVLSILTDGTLEALAGKAGTWNATKGGRFRGSNVIPVQAGDGEGLQDVEFDQFHRCLFSL
jgi:hypothetical protein